MEELKQELLWDKWNGLERIHNGTVVTTDERIARNA